MKRLTYKTAGVNIQKGDRASRAAIVLAKKTFRTETEEFQRVAAFSASFREYKNPYLLGATDGVGTKLKIAFEAGIHNTIGIDLVAMCVNDLVRRGAEPIIFLPYLAMQKINPVIAKHIMQGITQGCQKANCSIIGGETAELSDMYHEGEYDLAASSIGVVEKEAIITGASIVRGDQILAFPSSGLHSNGYTLARKILLSCFSLSDVVSDLGKRPLFEVLLTPTRIYVKPMLQLFKKRLQIHGIAHITGGGIMNKLGAIIPKKLSAILYKKTWTPHPIFTLIKKIGMIDEKEMFRTFNMGLGIILIVPKMSVQTIQRMFPDVIHVGEIETGVRKVVLL